jgi:hypothetical protein
VSPSAIISKSISNHVRQLHASDAGLLFHVGPAAEPVEDSGHIGGQLDACADRFGAAS